MRLKAYSTLTGDVLDLGEPTESPDQLLQLGETMATNRDGLIVFTEGPTLQQWEG